jgi:hypothetical protein
MGRWIVALLIAVGSWQAYTKYNGKPIAAAQESSPPSPSAVPVAQFRCDGRTHCSHMTSCEEATYFLRNCPDTKMDGDHDGVPCEQQWSR